MLQIERGLVSLIEASAFPPELLTSDSLREDFAFLYQQNRSYPPQPLPTLPMFGRVTPISKQELEGLHGSAGVKKIWEQLRPYLPVQVAPQLGMKSEITTSSGEPLPLFLEHQLRIYIHPLGFVSTLECRLCTSKALNGFEAARVLQRLERDRLLRIACAQFKEARNVTQLFAVTRAKLFDLVFRDTRSPDLYVSERPFCIVTLEEGTNSNSLHELHSKPDEQFEIYSAVQRITGNQHRKVEPNENRWFVAESRSKDDVEASGWRLGTKNGIATFITAGNPQLARQYRLCHHRNLVKIIGFHRLFHSFIKSVDDTEITPERKQLLQYAVNSVDDLRIQFSELWMRWAAERLDLETPVSSAVTRYGLKRRSPPHVKVNKVSDSVDFVIVTPLAQERDAVLKCLGAYSKVNPSAEYVHVYYKAEVLATFPDGTTTTYRIAVAPLNDMGRVEAADATADAIRRWHPRFVLLVGIAGGFRDAGVNLGDVLISKQVADYEEQKLKVDGSAIRWQVYRADPSLLAQAQSQTADWLKTITQPRPSDGIPDVHYGVVCTGDKVIANDLLKNYQKDWDRLIGTEMEAGGVARAAFQRVDAPGFFMIRGVSDLADGNKDSSDVANWRPYACDVAASFAVALLRSGPVVASAEP